MEKKIRSLIKKICCLVGAAVLAVASVPAVEAHAEDIYPGNYSVTVVPTYQNPDTGVIDDVGQNPGIGNMMVKAQVQSVGYVEIQDDGTIYLNMRWNQADANIYATFQTSSDGSQTWTDREFTVTNQVEVGDYEFEGNTFAATVTDYRFQLGTLNDTIRCTNYVEAMGREVVWFCYITDLVSGVGEEWTTIQAPDMSDYTESLSELESSSTSGSSSTGSSSTDSSSSGSSSTSTVKTPTLASGSTTTTTDDSDSDTSVEGIKDRTVADAQTSDSLTSSGESLDESTGIVGLDESDDESSADAETSSDTGASSGGALSGATGMVLVGAVCAIGATIITMLAMHMAGGRRRGYTDLFPDVNPNDAPNGASAEPEADAAEADADAAQEGDIPEAEQSDFSEPEETGTKVDLETALQDETEILKESMADLPDSGEEGNL